VSAFFAKSLLGGMVGGVYGTLRRIDRKGQAQRRVERSGRKTLEFARGVRLKRRITSDRAKGWDADDEVMYRDICMKAREGQLCGA
jgi:hypothetical protein